MALANKVPQELSVSQAILARRSVRAYMPSALDRTTIQTLLEAAVRAPTAMHQEPWAFVVVQDKSVLQKLSDRAKPLFLERLHRDHAGSSHTASPFENPDFNIFHDASTLIVICARRTSAFAEADCWLAAENLMLTACAMGLGTCVIGSAQGALAEPATKSELGIPPEYSAIAPIIVGVPRGETPSTSRKRPQVLSWK
jgi:nitroreductase